MRVTFYGVRGSHPMARRNLIHYGGNTTCVHFSSRSGDDLILDCGSGIRALGAEMMTREFGRGEGKAHILIGHTHWDHILGLPFFEPIYQAGNEFTIVSTPQNDVHIRDILRGQHDELHFPAPFEALSASIEFVSTAPGERLTLGGFDVDTVQLNHPGTTVGFRIGADDVSATVFTDNGRIRELRMGAGMGGPRPDSGFATEFLQRLSDCARDTDLLVHDTQFFEGEMKDRLFYGHSTVEDALEIARLSGARRLSLFHYDPGHSDADIDRQLTLAQSLCRQGDPDVLAVREGQTVDLAA